MAGGVKILPPPHPEVLVLPPNQPSSSKSKPSLSQVTGNHRTLKEPSTFISDVQFLEDGEIPPLIASTVTANSCPKPPNLNHPLSYSKIVQGHKDVLPISEVISVDPASLCQDSCSLKPLSVFEGKPCVSFKSSEKKILINNQKFVLVGKFSHGRPPFSAIKVFFAALKLQGRYNISIFDNKHLFIELDLKIDYVMVWLKLSWIITGYEMRIFKWESDFSPVKESAIAPVWIRIEGVPLYLFDKMSLLSIANAIGHPLSVHHLNVSRVKLNSAIICVELDVNTILMDSIYVCFEDDSSLRPVEGLWLKVFYDVIPPYCTSCLHIGHLVDVCKKGISELRAGISSSVPLEVQTKTASKVFDELPQLKKPTVSALARSFSTAGPSNNHGRTVKYTQVWRVNKDRGQVQHPNLSCVQEGLLQDQSTTVSISEYATGLVEVAPVFPAPAVDCLSFKPECTLSAQPNQVSPRPVVLPTIGDGKIRQAKNQQVAEVTKILEGANQQKSSVARQIALSSGSKDDANEKKLNVSADGLIASDVSITDCVTGLVEEAHVSTAPDVARLPVNPDCTFSVQLNYVSPRSEVLSTTGDGKMGKAKNKQIADATKIVARANQLILSSVVEQVTQPSVPKEEAKQNKLNVSSVGLLSCEVKPSWGERMEAYDQHIVREQKACIALVKDRTTTTQPGRVNFSERVAQKEHNEGLPLKHRTNANVGRTQQTSQKDYEYAQKKIDQIVIVPFSRRTSHEDSEVEENKSMQENPQTDLPPEGAMSFVSSEGIEISMYDYQAAGYRLIARRSLSPSGRSSSKLTSLRKKVEHIQICEEKTKVQDSKLYSQEYQADIERIGRPRHSSQGDKFSSPNGPGQSRQRRNRGRNRGSYGTPDFSQRYHRPGSH